MRPGGVGYTGEPAMSALLLVAPSVTVEVSLPHDLAVAVEEEVRVAPLEAVPMYASLTELSIGWSPTKRASFGGGYRLDLVDWEGPVNVRHRVHLDAAQSWKVQSLRLSVRERVQYRPGDENDDPRLVFRARAQVGWKAPGPVNPYLSVEPWLIVGEPRLTADKLRAELTLRGEVPGGQLRVGYRGDVSLDGDDDVHYVVIGYKGEVEVE